MYTRSSRQKRAVLFYVAALLLFASAGAAYGYWNETHRPLTPTPTAQTFHLTPTPLQAGEASHSASGRLGANSTSLAQIPQPLASNPAHSR